MAAINKKLSGAAWKLSRRHFAEVGEVESLLNFYYINTLHRHPFNPSRGVAEDRYNAVVLANAIHRVSRELSREARREARVVSLDAIVEESEVRDGE